MKLSGKKKWPWFVGIGVVIAALLLLLFWQKDALGFGKPTLAVETPPKLSVSDRGEFSLDVTVSHLEDALYPAMSMSIRFDASRLEFLGIEEGNLFVLDYKNSTGQQLPEWNCNVQNSNDKGLINVMYLDTTGGKHAFSGDLTDKDGNVVLRLSFRLRGSVKVGDVLDLIVEDAVFAASDESRSLAMTRNTLKTKNSKLVIGE